MENTILTHRELLKNKQKEFWIERKLNFVQLKAWEDNRMNVTENLATVIIGMLKNLFGKIEASAAENETLMQYFSNYIKNINENADQFEKNAKKFLSPLRQTQENSPFGEMLYQVESMDLNYAAN